MKLSLLMITTISHSGLKSPQNRTQYGMRSIREAVSQLAEADVKIKSTGADNYIVIDSLIASLLNTLSA